jgi:hypothetical protein
VKRSPEARKLQSPEFATEPDIGIKARIARFKEESVKIEIAD